MFSKLTTWQLRFHATKKLSFCSCSSTAPLGSSPRFSTNTQISFYCCQIISCYCISDSDFFLLGPDWKNRYFSAVARSFLAIAWTGTVAHRYFCFLKKLPNFFEFPMKCHLQIVHFKGPIQITHLCQLLAYLEEKEQKQLFKCKLEIEPVQNLFQS